MNSQFAYSNTKVDKAMSPEQFTQIVEAILAGKYSWACLLLLVMCDCSSSSHLVRLTSNRIVLFRHGTRSLFFTTRWALLSTTIDALFRYQVKYKTTTHNDES